MGVVTKSLLDTVLDQAVVGGCTSVGYRIRRNAWDPRDLEQMD